MPVEIRELVIQAKVLEDSEPAAAASDETTDALSHTELDQEEYLDQLVEKCLARLQEWLNEKSIR